MNKVCFMIISLALLAFASAKDPVVEISQGSLRGSIDTARNGRDFYQFKNIPYAKPPVGDLRFKAPIADEGWEGIRDNNDTIPKCFQYPRDGDTGSEDCLYLSVYTPELPSESNTPKPVMVFIHGGVFLGGNPRQGPRYILSEDVVLVVIAYRVGIFGFFNVDSPTLGVSGNAGMKDQVLALKWVQDNIAHFGGDPENVLLFGESAGAASVHLQILSPMAKGLFHKAISESGVALIDIVGGVRNNGIILAEELGIQTENLSDMLDTLQDMSALDIVIASNVKYMQTEYEEKSLSYYFDILNIANLVLKPHIWIFIKCFDEIGKTFQDLTQINERFNVPHLETESNETPFLPDEPINLMKSGNYNHVPYIIGYNDAEGLMFQISYKHATGSDIVISDFTSFIPPDLQIIKGSVEEEELAERIKTFYYGDTEPSSEDITQAIRLHTDYTFAYPSYRAAVEHVKTAIYPTYFYFFSADTELNLHKKQEETASKFPGATHGDEMHYLFNIHGFDIPEIIEGSVEDLGVQRMVTLWTNFAKYDNPTTTNDELDWKPLTESSFNYLHIDTSESSMESNLAPEIMEFWEQIYIDYFPGNK